MVLSVVVVVVVSEELELVVCSSFSPQEMMMGPKHEIRKMYKIFLIFACNILLRISVYRKRSQYNQNEFLSS